MRFMPPTSPRARLPESCGRADLKGILPTPSSLLSTRRAGEATDFPPLSKALQVHQETGKLSPRIDPQTANEERLHCLCPPHCQSELGILNSPEWSLSYRSPSWEQSWGTISERNFKLSPNLRLPPGIPLIPPFPEPSVSLLFPFHSASRISGFSVSPEATSQLPSSMPC